MKAEKKVIFEYGDVKRECRIKGISIKELKDIIPEFSDKIVAFMNIDNAEKYDNIIPFVIENLDFVIDKLSKYTDISKEELETDYAPAEIAKLVKELLVFNLGGELGEFGRSLGRHLAEILKTDSVQKILSEIPNQITENV